MEKFQIAEISGKQAHAGTKATEDVITIAKKMGFKPLYIQMNDLNPGILHKLNRQFQFYKDWLNAYSKITPKSVVLLQHPFHYPQLTREKILLKLKKKKNVCFVSVVHDVEELRTIGKENYHKHEFEFMMQIADFLIVHNNVMRDFFITKGFSKEKIVVLEIFDYLSDRNANVLPMFEKSITIAGNLDVKKSGYLADLPKLNCKFNLYGPNYSLGETDNIIYSGVLPPDQIPDVLTKGFGLIWDGDSIETCKGGFGDYLRYNNPHKLSLYLSSGIPVFIWKNAAEAYFVEKNGVGYLIDSLFQIPEIMERISENEYKEVVKNVRNLSMKLINGEYMTQALNTTIGLISNENKNETITNKKNSGK